jgi:hypothetical protein
VPNVAAKGLELSEDRLGDGVIRVGIGASDSSPNQGTIMWKSCRSTRLLTVTLGSIVVSGFGRPGMRDPFALDVFPSFCEQAAIRLELSQRGAPLPLPALGLVVKSALGLGELRQFQLDGPFEARACSRRGCGH